MRVPRSGEGRTNALRGTSTPEGDRGAPLLASPSAQHSQGTARGPMGARSPAGQRGGRRDREFQEKWPGQGGMAGRKGAGMGGMTMLQKRKRKIRQGDSHRTLNIHLLDHTWAYTGEGAGVAGRGLT